MIPVQPWAAAIAVVLAFPFTAMVSPHASPCREATIHCQSHCATNATAAVNYCALFEIVSGGSVAAEEFKTVTACHCHKQRVADDDVHAHGVKYDAIEDDPVKAACEQFYAEKKVDCQGAPLLQHCYAVEQGYKEGLAAKFAASLAWDRSSACLSNLTTSPDAMLSLVEVVDESASLELPFALSVRQECEQFRELCVDKCKAVEERAATGNDHNLNIVMDDPVKNFRCESAHSNLWLRFPVRSLADDLLTHNVDHVCECASSKQPIPPSPRPPGPTPPDQPDDGERGPSGGFVAGMVILVLLLASLAGFVGFRTYRRYRGYSRI